MKFFIDTADVAEIADLAESGLVDGVTTNPSLVAKSGRNFIEVVREICELVPGPVSAEVTAIDYDGMVAEGRKLARVALNVCVKVPLTWDGLKACRTLSRDGSQVNVTLCFSAGQALLAAKAGATSAVVPLHQLEELGQESAAVVRDVRELFDRGHVECDLIAAHPASGAAFTAAAVAGADAIVLDARALRGLLVHPLTDRGVDAFLRELATRGRPRIASL